MRDIHELLDSLRKTQFEERSLDHQKLEIAVKKGHLINALNELLPKDHLHFLLLHYKLLDNADDAKLYQLLADCEGMLKDEPTFIEMSFHEAIGFLTKKAGYYLECILNQNYKDVHRKIHPELFDVGFLGRYLPDIKMYDVSIFIPNDRSEMICNESFKLGLCERLVEIMEDIHENPDPRDISKISPN